MASDTDAMAQKEILGTGGRKGLEVNVRFRIHAPVLASLVTHNCKAALCLPPPL